VVSQAKTIQRVDSLIRRTSRGRLYYPERYPRKKTFWLRLRLFEQQSNFAAVWIVKRIISGAWERALNRIAGTGCGTAPQCEW
jgi:hypothetical protein